MKNMKMKIKAGDTVVVISGKDRGKTGTVSQVIAERNMVVVDGVNTMVKHLKSNTRDQKGQRIEYFGPIHASNVMLVDGETGKPGRVGYNVTTGTDGKKVKTRIVKPSQNRKKVTVKKETAEKKEAKDAGTAKAATPKKKAAKA